MDDQMLRTQFQTTFPQQPRDGGYERLREVLVRKRIKSRSSWMRFIEFPESGLRLVAAFVLLVLLVSVLLAGFFAIHQYAHRVIPVHSPSHSSSCSNGFRMFDSGTGWMSTRSRTTDRGGTWRNTAAPPLSGWAADCIVDGGHAWTAKSDKGTISVFATTDGGATWRQLGGVQAAEGSLVMLDFLDYSHGWMLVDRSAGPPATGRSLYATADGGASWRLIHGGTRADALQSAGGECGVSGLAFTSAKQGWVTWDCRYEALKASAVVIETADGGASWTVPSLPEVALAEAGNGSCTAGPPTFTGRMGVLPVGCQGNDGWTGLYRTADGGTTWTLSKLPGIAYYDFMDFADASTGFMLFPLQPRSQRLPLEGGADLYLTADSGQTWAPVKKGMFIGQRIDAIDFISAAVGYAYVTNGYDWVLWRTGDGGRTWSAPSGVRAMPGDIACAQHAKPAHDQAPTPAVMLNSATGWAQGALRTTDGGKHWIDVSPPSVANRAVATAEFYLDADHAWIAETAGSANFCADNVIVFSTADGGRSWQQAEPIHRALSKPGDRIWSYPMPGGPHSPAWQGAERMDFINADEGWILLSVASPPGGGPDQQAGPIYHTTDGGRHWSLLSNGPAGTACPAWPGIRFSSSETGWIGTQGSCGGSMSVSVTHDGGVTWKTQNLPPGCSCDSAPPIFFDYQHGVLPYQGYGNTALLRTSDGGQTWTDLATPAPNADSVFFVDWDHGWLTVPTQQNSAQLMATNDGGKTWIQLTMPAGTYGGQYSYTFSDPLNGLFAIEKGLYRTPDGGHTWVEVKYSVG